MAVYRLTISPERATLIGYWIIKNLIDLLDSALLSLFLLSTSLLSTSVNYTVKNPKYFRQANYFMIFFSRMILNGAVWA